MLVLTGLILSSSSSFAESGKCNPEDVMYDEYEGMIIEEEIPIIPITTRGADSGNSGYFNGYFTSMSWIKRGGVWSLSMKPTDKLRNGSVSDVNAAWNIVKDYGMRDSKWKNTSVMYWQFTCHVYASRIKYKETWNIEPHRTKIGVRCNDFPA